jgi:chromosome segregation ATPase
MEKLQIQLNNKESQFREMSAQLLNHLNKINKLTETIETLKSSNHKLEAQISEKDKELNKVLIQKAELFEILQKSENPDKNLPIINPSDPEPQVIPYEQPLNPVKEEENIEEEKKEEETKEQTYFSNEIDITAELEKLGIVELVKKY